jgi:hypothetical protein
MCISAISPYHGCLQWASPSQASTAITNTPQQCSVDSAALPAAGPPAGVERYALGVAAVGEPLPQARLQPQQPWSVWPAPEQAGVRRLGAVLRPVALRTVQKGGGSG